MGGDIWSEFLIFFFFLGGRGRYLVWFFLKIFGFLVFWLFWGGIWKSMWFIIDWGGWICQIFNWKHYPKKKKKKCPPFPPLPYLFFLLIPPFQRFYCPHPLYFFLSHHYILIYYFPAISYYHNLSSFFLFYLYIIFLIFLLFLIIKIWIFFWYFFFENLYIIYIQNWKRNF